jgi:AraC-like DNA-binding protein
VDDTSIAVYEPEQKANDSSLDIFYCLSGNRYCINPRCRGGYCEKAPSGNCADERSVDVFTISFKKAFFSGFQHADSGSITRFFETSSPRRYIGPLSVCGKSRMLLDQILHPFHEGILQQLYLQGKSIELLLCTTDCISQDKEDGFICRFLDNPDDRIKITKAHDLLLQHLDEPLTIRELSRKVAINECYLKKGFKEIYGTTIFDYFQKHRMEKARNLLCEQGLSVSVVASTLGYSCISHFSTAFRKHTGLKPCELLFR